MEGENPNLPTGRHSWPNHRYADQPSVTSHFSNAYLGPHGLLLSLPYLLILCLKLPVISMQIKMELGSFSTISENILFSSY